MVLRFSSTTCMHHSYRLFPAKFETTHTPGVVAAFYHRHCTPPAFISTRREWQPGDSWFSRSLRQRCVWRFLHVVRTVGPGRCEAHLPFVSTGRSARPISLVERALARSFLAVYYAAVYRVYTNTSSFFNGPEHSIDRARVARCCDYNAHLLWKKPTLVILAFISILTYTASIIDGVSLRSTRSGQTQSSLGACFLCQAVGGQHTRSRPYCALVSWLPQGRTISRFRRCNYRGRQEEILLTRRAGNLWHSILYTFPAFCPMATVFGRLKTTSCPETIRTKTNSSPAAAAGSS